MLSKKYLLLYFLMSVMFIMAFVHYYVGLELPIYYWDYARSWRMYYQYPQLLTQDVGRFFEIFFSYMRSEEYNGLSTMILSPFYFLSYDGTSRTSFISAIAIGYLIPLSVLLSLFVGGEHAKTSLPNKCYKKSILIFCFIISLTFIGFWKSILRGYTDIGGMIPLLMIIYYIFNHDLSLKFKIKQSLIMGLLFWLAFCLRRWYAYTIIAMFLILPIYTIYASTTKNWEEKIKNTIANYFLMGITSFILVFCLQQQVLQDILTIDYKYFYSAYRLPTSLSVQQFFENIGYIYISLSLICLIYAMVFIPRARAILVVMTLIALISYSLFYRTASPEIHHFIPLNVWFLLPILYALTHLLFDTYKKMFLALLFIVMNAFILFITAIPIYKMSSPLLPKNIYPLYVDNFRNYQKLVEFLDNTLKNGETVSVIGGGTRLNHDIISQLSPRHLRKNIVPDSVIDLRDGLSTFSLLSDYLVVSNPSDTYLPHGQENIHIITTLLLNQQGMGRQYMEVARFAIDGGDAIVYKKQSPFSKEDIDDYLNRLITYYPEWEYEYRTDYIYDLLSQ